MKRATTSLENPLLRLLVMNDFHTLVPSVMRRRPSGDFPFGKKCGDGPHTGRQHGPGQPHGPGSPRSPRVQPWLSWPMRKVIHLRRVLRKLEQPFEGNRIMASAASFPIAESQVDLRQPQYQKNREEWGPILEKLNQASAESSGEGDSKSIVRHLSRGQLLGM